LTNWPIYSVKTLQKLPDYILLDINMPIMNGWEFLDEYKRLNLDPLGKSKIYIISSSVFSNDINKARSYPLVKDFISKPLNVEKIKELFGVRQELNRVTVNTSSGS
jgi:CheY-like chemotaxis protein